MEEIVNAERRSVRPTAASSSAKTTWKRYLNSEETARIVFLVFGFVAILLVMIVLQKQTDAICCGDWDGYYHIKWSSMLWENFKQFKWLPTFEWLPLTVLNPKD